MKNEITMSIHDFMEMQRGNINLEDNNLSKHISKTINKIELMVALICIATPAPIKVFAADTTYVEAVNTVGEVLYVTTAVLLEIVYDGIVSTASMLC